MKGANEVLKAFIALVGMRDIGEGSKSTLEGLKRPSRFLPTLWRFGRDRVVRMAHPPSIPVTIVPAPPRRRCPCPTRDPVAWAIERTLIKQRGAILEAEYLQERIADAAIALVTSAMHPGSTRPRAGDRFRHPGQSATRPCCTCGWRIGGSTRPCIDLDNNDDHLTTQTANALVKEMTATVEVNNYPQPIQHEGSVPLP